MHTRDDYSTWARNNRICFSQFSRAVDYVFGPIRSLASINRQIEQKNAEAESITATIAKIDASLPLVEQQAAIRHKAMQIQYGNHIAWLEAQGRWSNSR